MRKQVLKTKLSVAVMLAITSPVPLVALSQGAAANVLEEITVTARKREESLRDIPLAITAFSEEDIEKSGFMNMEDIAKATPGMQFETDLGDLRPGRLYSSIRFRGIEGGAGPLQTANLFVDGVFVLQGAQALALTDIERVEVIKGPQSAVFGRNTFAGAINYITKNPNLSEFEGKVSADIGQYEQNEVSVSVEGPLIKDQLGFRLGVRSYNKGSMFTASDGGGLGEESSESLSLTVLATPNDKLQLRFRGSLQEDSDGPPASAYLKFSGEDTINDTCTGTSRGGYDSAGNRVQIFPNNFWCGKLPAPGSAMAPSIDGNTNLRPQFPSFQNGFEDFLTDSLINNTTISGVPSINKMGLERRMKRFSLSADYEFDSGITSSAIVAYNDNRANVVRDFDTTAIESFWASNPQKGTDKSIDFRITSPGESKFRWMVGVNAYEQEFLTSTASGDIVHVCGNFAGAPQGGFCDFPGLFPVNLTGSDFVEVWGLYGSVSYDFTDKLSVDIEGRYQEDTRGDGVSNTEITYEDFVPRISLKYELNDSINLYAVATQGLLPGVVNGSYNQCNNTPLVSPFIDPFTGLPSFSTECEQWVEQLGSGLKESTDTQTLDSYEVGVKSSWLDNKLVANLSVYWQEWENQPFGSGVQVYRDTDNDGVPNPSPNFLSASVPGSSDYFGVEFDANWYITPNWSAAFQVAYNDNEFTEFFLVSNINAAERLGTNNLKGNRSSRFPEWSGGLSSTYYHSIGEGYDAYVRGDVNYMGESFVGNDNLAYLDDYFTVNGRIGVESDGARLEFYVKNLFDEDKWRGGTNFADFSVVSQSGFDFSNGGILLMPQNKRTVGVRVSYRF